MKSNPECLFKDLKEVFSEDGIRWNEISDCASQIVLFGSRASQNAGLESDWDLLLVGDNPGIKINGVDLIWMSPKSIFTAQWLGSELANHIAYYGIWLHGDDDWSHKVYVSNESIEAKKQKISLAIRNFTKYLNNLEYQFTERRFTKIRCDLQRLKVLIGGKPVPPTAELNKFWEEQIDKAKLLNGLLTEINCDIESSQLLTEFGTQPSSYLNP
jgi:hypothetical protein